MQPFVAARSSAVEPTDSDDLTPRAGTHPTDWRTPWSAVVVCCGRSAPMARAKFAGWRHVMSWLRLPDRHAGRDAEPVRRLIELAGRYGIDGICLDLPVRGELADPNAIAQLLAAADSKLRFCVRLDAQALQATDTAERLAPLLTEPRYLRLGGHAVVYTAAPAHTTDAVALQALQQRLAVHGGPVTLRRLVDISTGSDPAPTCWPATGCLHIPQVRVTERGRRGRARAHLNVATQFQSMLQRLSAQSDQNAAETDRVLVLSPWQAGRDSPGLEPHPVHGDALLQALSTTLANHTRSTASHRLVVETQHRFRRQHNACVVLHLYHEDLIGALVEQTLAPLADVVDVAVTVRPDVSPQAVQRIVAACPNVHILIADNRGRDVRPFLLCLAWLQQQGYPLACKVHSKKSPHRVDGDAWRRAMVADLLGSTSIAKARVTQFQEQPDLGLLAPAGALTPIDPPGTHHSNAPWLNRLRPPLSAGRARAPAGDATLALDPIFPAGTMFWFRTAALLGLLDHPAFDASSFEPEWGQLDGTLAHALERLMALQVQHAGLRVAEVSRAQASDTVPATEIS